jgi:hypothetical protein
MAQSMAAGQPSAAVGPTMLQRAAHHGLVTAVAAEAPALTATAALFARCHSLLIDDEQLLTALLKMALFLLTAQQH